jgi:hypothetical protein
MNINEFKWLYMGREVHLLNFPNSAIPKHTRPYKPHGGGPPAEFDQIQAIQELDLRDTQRNLLFMKAIGEIKPVYNLTMNEAEAILEIGGTFMDPDPWAPSRTNKLTAAITLHEETESLTVNQMINLEQFKTAKGPGYVNARMLEALDEVKDIAVLSRDEAAKLLATIKNKIRWNQVYDGPKNIR